MKKLFLAVLAASLFLLVSCGDNKKNDPKEEPENDTDQISDEEPSDSDAENDEEPVVKPDTDPVEPEPVEPLDCENVADGMNKNLMVGDYPRDFILRLPEDAGSMEKLPVVFAWHGYGDTADNFDSFLSGLVDNESMPFILVVPEADTTRFGLQTMQGLDWDMLNVADGSAEADMFDQVLSCIGEKWTVDEEHIHLSGFSAGAITANSVAQLKSDKVASVFTYSGAYFSDPESVAALEDPMGFVAPMIQWPEMEAEHNAYTQVLVSGEAGVDTWGMASFFNIDFNVMANKAAKYLNGFGHDVVLCNHGGSHTVAGPTPATMIQFFSEHPFGAHLAYKELPEGYDVCKIYGDEEEPETDDDPTQPDSDSTDEPENDENVEPDSDDTVEPDTDEPETGDNE
jgi:predicted esterase